MNLRSDLLRSLIVVIAVPALIFLVAASARAGQDASPSTGPDGGGASVSGRESVPVATAPADDDDEEDEEKDDDEAKEGDDEGDDEAKKGDDEEEDDEEKEKEEEARKRIARLREGTRGVDEWAPADPDARFVKENLKEFIHGELSFARDGTTTIGYDFQKKNTDHQGDFLPPISPKAVAAFRWSVHQEEFVQGGATGIRISDKGLSILKDVWFEDDVEATIEYVNGITWTSRHVCVVFFQPKSGKGLGNNFGGQVANMQDGNYKGGIPGTTEPVQFGDTAKITIRLKKGVCEVLRNGRVRQTMKYSSKSMKSGRIGINWGGNIAGTITGFTVKGKLDIPAMMKVMRGSKK